MSRRPARWIALLLACAPCACRDDATAQGEYACEELTACRDRYVDPAFRDSSGYYACLDAADDHAMSPSTGPLGTLFDSHECRAETECDFVRCACQGNAACYAALVGR
jgi:hypothetical protein